MPDQLYVKILRPKNNSGILKGFKYFAIERDILPDHYVLSTDHGEVKITKKSCKVIFRKKI
jgi:hypothetical protein